MISARSIPAFCLAALTGCANHTDLQHQPLPRDQRHLSIVVPDRGRVSFMLPPGWHVVQRPSGGNPGYVLKKEPLGDVSLSVFCHKAAVTPDTDANQLANKKLDGLRDPFGSAGCEQIESEETGDGKMALIYLYVADGEELCAIIPDKGFWTEVTLHTIQSIQDLAANRPAFLALLHSLHTR
ncbi:MAG: hypothetical protein M3463_07860 [Verrucomicrobiota bacterium]|nr:hypothetical protein [Verrucomicrobiota bacterium]